MAEFVKGDRVQTKYEEEAEIIAVFLAPDLTWLWLKFDHSDHPVTRKATEIKKVQSNEEKLYDMIAGSFDHIKRSSQELAKYLDEHGVTAP